MSDLLLLRVLSSQTADAADRGGEERESASPGKRTPAVSPFRSPCSYARNPPQWLLPDLFERPSGLLLSLGYASLANSALRCFKARSAISSSDHLADSTATSPSSKPTSFSVSLFNEANLFHAELTYSVRSVNPKSPTYDADQLEFESAVDDVNLLVNRSRQLRAFTPLSRSEADELVRLTAPTVVQRGEAPLVVDLILYEGGAQAFLNASGVLSCSIHGARSYSLPFGRPDHRRSGLVDLRLQVTWAR